MNNKLFIYTLWRSGTHWLSNMISDLLKIEWVYYDFGNNFDYLKKILKGNEKDRKIIVSHIAIEPEILMKILEKFEYHVVFLFRDPRDVIVSTVYMRKYVEGFRRNLPPFPLMGFRDIFYWELGHYHKTYTELLPSWVKFNRKDKINVRYEDLKKESVQVLKKIVEFLNVNIKESTIKKVVEKYSFKNVSGREEGIEDIRSHYRKGIVGGWKDNLSIKDSNILNISLLKTLVKLKYMPNIEMEKNLKKKIINVLKKLQLNREKKFYVIGFGTHTIGLIEIIGKENLKGIIVRNYNETYGEKKYFGIPLILEKDFLKSKYKYDYLLISSYTYEKEIFLRWVYQYEFNSEKIILFYNSKDTILSKVKG